MTWEPFVLYSIFFPSGDFGQRVYKLRRRSNRDDQTVIWPDRASFLAKSNNLFNASFDLLASEKKTKEEGTFFKVFSEVS